MHIGDLDLNFIFFAFDEFGDVGYGRLPGSDCDRLAIDTNRYVGFEISEFYHSSIIGKKNKDKIGNTYRVAVDGISEAGVMVGHAGFQSPEIDGIVIWKEESDPGTFVDVEMTGYKGYDLEGRIKKK